MRAATIALAVTVLGFACTSGCGTQTTPSDASPKTATGYLGLPVCTSCLRTACALELVTCDGNASCREIRTCRAACDGAACDAACLSGHPSDAGFGAAMDALAACARAHCSADCPGPPTTPERVAECTAAFDVELADLSGDCDAQRDCACRNCNDDWLACLADPRCIAFLDCSLRVCSGVACANTSGQCGLQLTDAPFRRTRFCGEQYCGACLAGGRDN